MRPSALFAVVVLGLSAAACSVGTSGAGVGSSGCAELAEVCSSCDAADPTEAALAASCKAVSRAGYGPQCEAALSARSYDGCKGGGSPTGGSTTGGGSTATGGPAGGSGPRVLTFTTNATKLTPSQSLVFTAVVTDPDGIDDVIGGTLTAPGGASYGAFAADSQEGAYQITLTWADLDAVRSADLTYGSSDARDFVATFYDTAGHTTSAATTVTLQGEHGFAVCDGESVDTTQDWTHCGSCGAVCHVGGTCSSSSCWEQLYSTTPGSNCKDFCEGAVPGGRCFDSIAACHNHVEPSGGGANQPISCTSEFPSDFGAAGCCCGT